MSERITNGIFESDFDSWTNGPGSRHPFVWMSGKAQAESDHSPDELRFWMEQEFSLIYEAVSAVCTVWAGWESIDDGYVEFYVILKKPSGEDVVLYNATKTGAVGDGNVVDDADILAHLDEYGNYKIILIADVKSSAVFQHTKAWFDNISINIAIKRTKVVIEGRGCAGTRAVGTQATVLENRGLAESKSTRVFKAAQILLATLGRAETVKKTVKKIVMETLGRAEDLIRVAFSEAITKVEGLARSEAMTAKKTSGNLETTYNFVGDTEWDEIAGVRTNWIKTKVQTLGG